MLIDTHAHLDDERFASDLADVVRRAQEAGIEHVITIGTTAESSQTALSLASQFSALSAAVGIQPNHVAQAQTGDWDRIVRLSSKEKVSAIGETGLDRYWDFTPFEQQEDYFARHLELAHQLELPVVIHCRDAEADTLAMLRERYDRHGPISGVMHSFTGSLETALACLEMGLYISFAGMVTYKNADDLRQVAKKIPLERMLVETDSPYLSPVPKRGKRNEPAHLVHTASFLADLLAVDFAFFAQQTSRNARELFRLNGKD
ncbi:MAG: deoxyribonuclease [Gemmatales bacterium]|nr:MAG: deoxyribonuclease [Gemmatales bacterium]